MAGGNKDSRVPDPTEGTIRKLFALQVECAYPDCGRALVERDDRGNLTTIADIAHILPASPNGPRPWGDVEYSNEEIRGYDNLVLLCKPHHKTVDDHWQDYPAEELRAWKAQAEQVAEQDPGLRAEDLLKIIDRLTEYRSQAESADEPELPTWEELRLRCRAETDRHANDIQARAPAADPDGVYVERQHANVVLDELLASREPALVVAGDAGVGKTTLLLRWARRLDADGHAVVFMSCNTMMVTDVLGACAHSIGVADRGDWPAELAELCSENGQHLVLIVDGIDELPSSNGGVAVVDDLNRRLPSLASNVNVILSTSKPGWERLSPRLRPGPLHAHNREPVLILRPFDDTELREAWSVYADQFNIGTNFDELPAAMCKYLHNPAMLSLVASTYANSAVPDTDVAAAVDLFRRYYEAKVDDPSRPFLSELTREMYRLQKSPVGLEALRRHDILGDALADDEGPYAAMVGRAVLHEAQEQTPFAPRKYVDYTIGRFGSWMLASVLQRGDEQLKETIVNAVAHSLEYPPAWDAARMLLVTSTDRELYSALGASPTAQVRELVVDALEEIATTEPNLVVDIVRALVFAEGPDAEMSRRTGLLATRRVAGRVPDAMSAIFLEIAQGGDESLREATQNALYLMFKSDPDFVFAVLNAMVESIQWSEVAKLWKLPSIRHVIEFVADLVITIYTLQPGWQVGKLVSDLAHKLFVDRLKLPSIAGPEIVRKLLFKAADRQYSARVFDGFLFGDVGALERVFDWPAEDRRRLGDAVAMLDPAVALEPLEAELHWLLEREDAEVLNILAAQIIAAHAVVEPESTAALVRRICDGTTRHGRLWLLTGFIVVSEGTPTEWVPLLEDLTRQTVTAHPELLGDPALGRFVEPNIDQLLVGLGLAYGKRGQGMELFDELIESGIRSNDAAQVRRCVSAIGVVGFHHPAVALDRLIDAWQALSGTAALRDQVGPEFVEAFAVVRVLHLDAVDRAVGDVDGALLARVLAEEEPGWLRPHVRRMGLYNNGVHEAVCAPLMREEILKHVYTLLVTSTSLSDAVDGLTRHSFELLEQADYRLENWLGPSRDGICR